MTNFESQDRVSIWIGDVPDRDTLDAYLREDYSGAHEDGFPTCLLWKDLGVDWHDHDFQEVTFDPAQPPVEDLLARLSWVDSFKTDVLARCRKLNILRANAAVIFYEYEFAAPFASPYLRFVGSFPYSTDGHPFRRDALSAR